MEEDAELLRRIAAGSEAAMRMLYDRHSEAIWRFARSCLADAFEASDVMHETMLFVWGHAARFEGRSAVRTWLFSIARNKAIDRLRRAAKMELGEPDPTVPEEAPAAEQLLLAAEEAQHLRACLERLGPLHRSVIHLAFFEELPYAEIAAIEGCPIGTVKTRVMHAKRLLLACLQAKGVVRG